MSKLQINPFFDGELGNAAGGQQALAFSRTLQGTDSGGGYRDVSTERLHDDRSPLSVMRPGAQGLRGVIIPHATPGGIPVGTRPHDVSDVEVTVDPHIEQRFKVRLRDINRQSLAEAEAMAKEVTPDPYSVETSRLRGAAVLNGISVLAGTPLPAVPGRVPTPAIEAPGNIAAANLAHIAGQLSQQQPRTIRPLAAFNGITTPVQPLYPVHNAGTYQRNIDLAGEPSAAPNVRVTFEFPGRGTQFGRYHHVIIQEKFIVLILHGDDCYLPPDDGTEPIAVHVEGSRDVYLTHSVGISYPYAGITHIVLLVEKSATLDAQE